MELALKQKIKIYIEGFGEEVNAMVNNVVSNEGEKDELKKGVTEEAEKTWRNLESLIDREG